MMLLIPIIVFAESPQPYELIRTSTGGLLEHLHFDTEAEILPAGEVALSANMGFFGRAQLGVSYAAQNIIGFGKANFVPHAGFEVKARVLDEHINYPAVVLGINTQGYGGYIDSLDRYLFKSIGPYIAVSKNWWALGGNAGVHGGINYSLETKDDKSVSFFLGVDKDYDGIAGIYIEYDAALNDNIENNAFGEGSGYLNASLWWHVTDYFKFEIFLLDCLSNSASNPSFGRGLRVTFYNNF
ncbi:MAG: hypothetical protein ACLFSQ_07810 [Candidatus Zixiibacteriota bacterium]